MTEIHKRAKVGGEYGANGEWYEGGKFINTVPENEKGEAKRKKATGKQEYEPYRWKVAPVEGQRSLYRLLAGVEHFDPETLQFKFNGLLLGDLATCDYVAIRKSRIDAFNAGERWTTLPTQQSPAPDGNENKSI